MSNLERFMSSLASKMEAESEDTNESFGNELKAPSKNFNYASPIFLCVL